MKKYILIYILTLFTTLSFYGQNDCKDALIVCGNSGYQDLAVTGSGIQELNISNSCASIENNSIWFKLIINKGGTLGFTLIPKSSDIQEDFDFFIFGPNSTCSNLGQSIRCSTTNPKAAFQSNNLTGMNASETDTFEGPGPDGNSFVKWLTVQDGETYFLVVDRFSGESNFDLEWIGSASFSEQPTFDYPTGALDIEQCDADGNLDDKTNFDLTINNNIAIGSQSNVIPTYYTSNNDALLGKNPIPDFTNFRNSVNPQKVYIRLTNSSTGCFNVSDFYLKVKSGIAINPPTDLKGCDTNSDGFYTFNLSENDAINPDSVNNSITYFSSETDATSNNITSKLPLAYTNKVANTPETIWARIENSTMGCFSTTSFKIEVVKLPTINSNFTLKQCDEDGMADGFTDFNLVEANDYLTLGDSSLVVSYFLTSNNAESKTDEIATAPFSNKKQSTVFARIENNNGCYRIAQVNLLVSSTHFPANYLKIDAHCDDDDIIDGKSTFILSDYNSDILSQFPTGQNLAVSYYRNLLDAELEQNKISTTIPYQNETPFSQTLFVRVESNDNGECFGLGPHLKLIVNERPQFNLDSTAIYCTNLNPIIIYPNNANGNYSYQWFDENGNAIGSNESQTINKKGVYHVIATSSYGCNSFPKFISIQSSSIAAITTNNISIHDDSPNNTIEINTSNLGIGKYEFAIDNNSSNYQDEPYFENISSGIHTLYIRDKNYCGVAQLDFSVIGYPKFFTPNNDGYNDYWQVLGVNQNFYPNSLITIFDRFGKIVKKIDPKSKGWDGTFKGRNLPASDYWFYVELIDSNGNPKIRTGHFSLIR